MITDVELTRRLAHDAAPRHAPLVPAPVLTALVSETRTSAESSSLRRRLAGGIVGVSVVVGGLLVAPSATAAIERFLAQTTITFSGSDVIDESEFVDTSAPDLGAYIESIYPEWLPLAPGQTRAVLIEQVRAAMAAEPGIQQEVGILRELERRVYIAWLDEWIDAYRADDPERMSNASAVLTSAATWPAFAATDGGGVTAIMAAYAEEIAIGNIQAAQELAQVEGAPSWDGIDRADRPGSYYARFLDEYRDGQ